jgi:glycyl-tRNA synthetase beta subunit
LSQEVEKLSDVNEEVERMVKTLYDPKVEERGMRKATLRTKREDILALLEDIGNISDEVKALVEKEDNLDMLKKWLKLAARVGSIDEFMDKVRLH